MAFNSTGLASGFAQGFGLANQYLQQQHENTEQAQERAWQHQKYRQQRAEQEQEQQQQQDMQKIRSGYTKISNGQHLSQDEVNAFQRNPWLAPGHISDERMGRASDHAQRVMDPEDSADANDQESLDHFNFMFGPRIQRGHGKNKLVTGIYPGKQSGHVALDMQVTDDNGNTYNAPMTRNRGREGEDDEVLEIPADQLAEHAAGYRALHNVLKQPGMQENVRQAQQQGADDGLKQTASGRPVQDDQQATARTGQQQGMELDLTPQDRREATRYAQQMGLLPKGQDNWKTIRGDDGSIMQRNTKTGKLRTVRDPESEHGGGNQYAPSSMMKTVDALMRLGGYSFDDALDKYQQLKGRGNQGQEEAQHVIGELTDQINNISDKLNSTSATVMDKKRKQQMQDRLSRLRHSRARMSTRAYGRDVFGDTEDGTDSDQNRTSSESRPTDSDVSRSGSSGDFTEDDANDVLNSILNQ